MTRLARCYAERPGAAWKGKAKFGSKGDAMKIANRGRWWPFGRSAMTAYRCSSCAHWHLRGTGRR